MFTPNYDNFVVAKWCFHHFTTILCFAGNRSVYHFSMASPVFVSPFLYKLTDVCHSSTFSYDIAHEVGPAHFTFRLKFHTMLARRSQGESPPRTQLVALWVFIMRTVTSACIVANGPPTAALALMSHYGRVSTQAPWLRFIDADEANAPQYADTDVTQQDGLPTPVGSSDALVCTPLRQFKRKREETSHVATPISPSTSSTSILLCDRARRRC